MHNMHMPLKSISSHGFFPPTKTSKISPSRKDSDSVAESSQSRSAQSRTTSRTPVSRQVGKPMDRYGSVGDGVATFLDDIFRCFSGLLWHVYSNLKDLGYIERTYHALQV